MLVMNPFDKSPIKMLLVITGKSIILQFWPHNVS